MKAMTVCVRVYTVGKRRFMYLMSYATDKERKEEFVFFKAGTHLAVRVNRQQVLLVLVCSSSSNCSRGSVLQAPQFAESIPGEI